jgi:hypothetical protein
MRKILFLAAMPFMLAGMPAKAQLTGEFGIVEHACVLPIATFVFQNCGFSGGANIAADLTGGNEWIGPLDSGGFYTSIAAAPGFVLSTQTGVDADGTALNTFMVYEGSSAGDGKVAPSVTSNISVDTGTNMVSGSFTIGAGARAASGGGTLAGSGGTVESWTSIVHVLTAKTADSVIGGNAFGGSDYILGSIGFPSLDTLCTADNCYGNVETAAVSGAPANTSPWAVATGGTGPQSSIFGTTGVDIVSYTNAFPVGAPANVGTKTTATMNGFDCVDNGIEPREAGDPVTTDTGCMVSSVTWGSEVADPIDGLARNNASFDNVIMKVSTDSGDNVVAVEAYYLLEYSIISEGANSNVGGIFVAIVPVPAAVWLFGSALGLLGWIRRRVAV